MRPGFGWFRSPDIRLAQKLLNDPGVVFRSSIAFRDQDSMFHSKTPAMAQIGSVVKRVAPTDLGVLITGESGVGKEVIARRIYSESLRCDQPFVKINSAAIPDSLIESELLGHHQGAFTGANATRKGAAWI